MTLSVWSLKWVLVFHAALVAVECISSSSKSGTDGGTSTKLVTATIAVCTGADCRVDGASDALRHIQRGASVLNRKLQPKEEEESILSALQQPRIAVTSRPCLGPCGDGPCVLVLDKHNKRVAQTQPPETRGQGSLAPADMFGSSTKGVYQARTQENIDFILRLAATTTAGLLLEDHDMNVTMIIDQKTSQRNSTIVAHSVRPWFDRPRNERKFLQRLGQFLVLVGIYEYDQTHGIVGNEQWIVASLLVFTSNFIMKENIMEQMIQTIKRKI